MSIGMPVADGSRASGLPRGDGSKRRRSKKKRPAPERNLLLEASDVHVRYRIRASRPVEQALRARRLPDSGRDTHAVRGVTLQVREGDCIGIIGSNGAGKSSLLRAIAGLEPLASGQLLAVARPRLLGIGAALKPAWTGWETIDVGLIAMGVSRERRPHIAQEIAAFTELGPSLELPVATYSRGMGSRLLFGISTAVPARILLIDESLGGADGRFKARAEARVQAMLKSSEGIVIVSHSMSTIRQLATEVVWLEQGRVTLRGEPDSVTAAYTAANA
jgi:teichoic acid transport system ATP-binding protein